MPSAIIMSAIYFYLDAEPGFPERPSGHRAKNDPLQLTVVKMNLLAGKRIEKVNEYRAEVGI